jgi:arsenite transporter
MTEKRLNVFEKYLTLWVFLCIPLFIQTVFIFALTYFIAKKLKFKYEDAAPSAMIGASNHFEVAIATAPCSLDFHRVQLLQQL